MNLDINYSKANNPYTYTLKSLRDSLKLFEDNISYLTIKPKKNEMIVQSKAIYTGVKNNRSASRKNYYGFDTNHKNYKITTNTVGELATFKYGLSDDTAGKVSYNLELEQINRMIYTAGMSLEFTKDYNRNVNTTIGIGYKFWYEES